VASETHPSGDDEFESAYDFVIETSTRTGLTIALRRHPLDEDILLPSGPFADISTRHLSQEFKMADLIVVGDGPGGLSAALFLAKNGKEVVVFGQDKTVMHWAMLHNYLGIPEMTGSDFQGVAREQVAKVGATLRAEKITAVAQTDAGFSVKTEGGESIEARWLVLSEGKSPTLAGALGVAIADDGTGVQVDRNGRTSLQGVYAVGRMVRLSRSQAIISAGDGAAAALDILSADAGKDVQDWDSPPKD